MNALLFLVSQISINPYGMLLMIMKSGAQAFIVGLDVNLAINSNLNCGNPLTLIFADFVSEMSSSVSYSNNNLVELNVC